MCPSKKRPGAGSIPKKGKAIFGRNRKDGSNNQKTMEVQKRKDNPKNIRGHFYTSPNTLSTRPPPRPFSKLIFWGKTWKICTHFLVKKFEKMFVNHFVSFLPLGKDLEFRGRHLSLKKNRLKQYDKCYFYFRDPYSLSHSVLTAGKLLNHVALY